MLAVDFVVGDVFGAKRHISIFIYFFAELSASVAATCPTEKSTRPPSEGCDLIIYRRKDKSTGMRVLKILETSSVGKYKPTLRCDFSPIATAVQCRVSHTTRTVKRFSRRPPSPFPPPPLLLPFSPPLPVQPRVGTQVSFKKKESERATAARKSTYAYKKSIEDAEPWVALEVHGQNDQRSLDEFARMFSDHDNSSGGASTAKHFPPPERYLKGLDYMEEYDENGESFSVGGGR